MRCKCGKLVDQGKTWEISPNLCWDCDQALIAERDGTQIKYGDYIIELNVKPIPIRCHDWEYCHKDYDGPEDGRAGTGASIIDCICEIDNA